MKLPVILLSVLFLAGNAAAAVPEKTTTNLWMHTNTHWVRSDWYGSDADHNGRIDPAEWVLTRTTGQGEPPQVWAIRRLKAGEAHRWSLSSEESWQSAQTPKPKATSK